MTKKGEDDLVEYFQSLTFDEKKKYYEDCETNENISAERFNIIDRLYWEAEKTRQDHIDNECCPDCGTKLTKETIIIEIWGADIPVQTLFCEKCEK